MTPAALTVADATGCLVRGWPRMGSACKHAARVAVVKDGVIVGWQCVDCPDIEPDNTPEPTGEAAMSREKPWVCPICGKGPCVCTEDYAPRARVLRWLAALGALVLSVGPSCSSPVAALVLR